MHVLIGILTHSNRATTMTATMQREIAQELQLKWNLDDVDVRTKTVERTLAPLVNQVSTLVVCCL